MIKARIKVQLLVVDHDIKPCPLSLASQTTFSSFILGREYPSQYKRRTRRRKSGLARETVRLQVHVHVTIQLELQVYLC